MKTAQLIARASTSVEQICSRVTDRKLSGAAAQSTAEKASEHLAISARRKVLLERMWKLLWNGKSGSAQFYKCADEFKRLGKEMKR